MSTNDTVEVAVTITYQGRQYYGIASGADARLAVIYLPRETASLVSEMMQVVIKEADSD